MQAIDKSEMGEKDIQGLLFKYSLPAIIGMLSHALYNMVDTIFIGQGVGTLAIAALSLSFPIQLVSGAFALMCAVGCASVESILFGQKKDKEASVVVGNTFILNLIFAILYTVGLIFFMNPILRLIGASTDVMPYCKDYLFIIAFGTIFIGFSMTCENVFRAVGRAKESMWTMLIGTIVNVILDPIFIFWFKLGISGAAWATIIGQMCSAILGFIFIKKGCLELKLIRKDFILKATEVKKILSIGLPTLVRQLGVSIAAFVANYQLSIYGTDMLIAAYGITVKFNSVFILPMFGFGQGAQPLIGYNFGAKKIKRVRKTLVLTQKFSIIIGLIGFAGALFIPRTLISMFTSDSALITLTVFPLRIVFSTFVLIAISTTGSTMFQATGHGKEAFFLNLLRQTILFVPFVFILPLIFGVNGIFYTYIISEFICALITFIETKKGLNRMELELKA